MPRRPLREMEETNEAFHFTVPKPSLRYVDFFLSLKCVGTLAATGFYPSAKEISETIGIFEAARNRLRLAYSREDVLAVSVGDGVWPRTAAYVSYLSRWRSVSVDPLLRYDHPNVTDILAKTRGLSVLPHRIEDVTIDATGAKDVVFLFVHSHASLHAAARSLRNAEGVRVHALSMPCCFGDDLGLPPSETYEDPLVLSVKRSIQVYRSFSLENLSQEASPTRR